jgi:hypothetical protein
MVVTDEGLLTPWPVATDFILPHGVAQAGLTLANPRLLECFAGAATDHVMRAIQAGDRDVIQQAVVTFSPSSAASERAWLAVAGTIAEHGGMDMVTAAVDRQMRDAALEGAQQARATREAAERECEAAERDRDLELQRLEEREKAEHSRRTQRLTALRAEFEPLRQEVEAMQAALTAIQARRYDVWQEVQEQCRKHGIFVGSFSSESERVYLETEALGYVQQELHRIRTAFKVAKNHLDAAREQLEDVENLSRVVNGQKQPSQPVNKRARAAAEE